MIIKPKNEMTSLYHKEKIFYGCILSLKQRRAANEQDKGQPKE